MEAIRLDPRILRELSDVRSRVEDAMTHLRAIEKTVDTAIRRQKDK